MNLLSRCFGRNVPNTPQIQDSQYFNELERLSIPNSDDAEIPPSEKEINARIKDLFEQHSDSLIADLLANPNHRKNYRMIGASLKNSGLLNTFQASIGYVQKIAHLLENHRVCRNPWNSVAFLPSNFKS